MGASLYHTCLVMEKAPVMSDCDAMTAAMVASTRIGQNTAWGIDE